MNKGVKITLWAVGGTMAALLIALCVLLRLGYRFSSEAAVHEFYQNNPVIHTDEYDFYVYGDGHVTVKKYGLLYKQIDDTDMDALVAENGERVGYLYSYQGKNQTYCIISWAMSDYTMNEEGLTVTRKYKTDTITLNGKETALDQYCYFVTDELIETLVIMDTNVFVTNCEL